jgi:ATP-binding cassette subfamily C (CFTR/MRP) protein 1
MRNSQIPLQPSTLFSHDYLKASNHRQQALCGNVEGWGPLSPDRFDFTPCFLDIWVALVAVGGVLGGAAAIYYLLKHCPSQPVKKNWHFFAKLVRPSIIPPGTISNGQR